MSGNLSHHKLEFAYAPQGKREQRIGVERRRDSLERRPRASGRVYIQKSVTNK